MKLNISSGLKTAKTIITANSPVLLVGAGIAGVVATGVLSAKAGYKARGMVDEATVTKGEELTLQEKFGLTWLCYAVPAVTGASTIASICGVHYIHTKRHAGLSALYAISQGKLDDVSDKAEELLGAKKTQDLQNATAQKQIDGHPIVDSEVIMTGDGTELCYDEWSCRYFMSSMNKLEAAINEMNRQLIDEGDASLNDFYERIGLPPMPMGTSYGWSGTKLEGKFGAVKTSDGRPALSVWFHENPKENLGH